MDAVADVRAFLRMEEGVEQVLLERLVESAVALGEAFSRILRDRDGWRAMSEFAVRMYREDG